MIEPNAVAGEVPAHTPYLLFGGSSNGLHECHLYCHVAEDEVVEVVTPDGDVVGRWPSDQVRTPGVHIASGNRLFFDRADLSVRIVRRDSV